MSATGPCTGRDAENSKKSVKFPRKQGLEEGGIFEEEGSSWKGSAVQKAGVGMQESTFGTKLWQKA